MRVRLWMIAIVGLLTVFQRPAVGGDPAHIRYSPLPPAGGLAQATPNAPNRSAPVVGRYEIFEETFHLASAGYPNPWEDVNLTVTFTAPGGQGVDVGGFYFAPNTWKVRLAPWEVGRWEWTAVARDRARMVLAASGAFTVVASANPGFVRRSTSNRLRLVYDNGTLFPAIGLGDCIAADPTSPPGEWGLDGGARTSPHEHGRGVDIDTYLSAYARAGFNLFRWSVGNCAFRLWETISPEGNRYLGREGSWGDELVRKLHQYGFRVYMTIFDTPPFSHEVGDTANMDAVSRYARYIVDRYGAFVDFWELMNESDATDPWYTIVAGAIRSADPYHHLISTSWEKPQLPVIDIISPHWYQRESEYESDVAAVQQIERWKDFRKPIIFGEQGNDGSNWDERSALRMRLRSWTAFFDEATLIFWNTSGFKGYQSNLYLGPEERGFIRSLQTFVHSIPPDVQRSDVAVSPPERVRAYGLRSSKVLAAYLHNFTDHARPTSGISIRIDSPGVGTAEWYDPATGTVIQTTRVGQGRQTLQVPPFVVDVALRIGPPGP